MSDVALVILAGGKGTRIQKDVGNDLPKALQPLNGKPLIKHLLENIKDAPIQRPPIIVIGFKGEKVQEELGSEFQYVWQLEQLGTGHATAQARSALEGKAKHVLVLYGDHPNIPQEVIEKIVRTHLGDNNTLTLATTIVPDFHGLHAGLKSYGRIKRNPFGEIVRIIEFKDATEEERDIKEVNPGYGCYRADWLWENLDKIENNNAQGEYYLTDLLELAIEQGERVEGVLIDPICALGVNTMEELARLEKLLVS